MASRVALLSRQPFEDRRQMSEVRLAVAPYQILAVRRHLQQQLADAALPREVVGRGRSQVALVADLTTSAASVFSNSSKVAATCCKIRFSQKSAIVGPWTCV